MKKHVLTPLRWKDWERLRVSWIAKKINKWVFNKAGVKRELLDTVKATKLAYYGHTMIKQLKQGSCLEKQIMQGTTRCARQRGRPCTAWMDNITSRFMTNYPIRPWVVALIIHCCSLYHCPAQLTLIFEVSRQQTTSSVGCCPSLEC